MSGIFYRVVKPVIYSLKLTTTPTKLRDNRTKFHNKLVAEKELEDYLNNGWEMVQIVNNKILI